MLMRQQHASGGREEMSKHIADRLWHRDKTPKDMSASCRIRGALHLMPPAARRLAALRRQRARPETERSIIAYLWKRTSSLRRHVSPHRRYRGRVVTRRLSMMTSMIDIKVKMAEDMFAAIKRIMDGA